MALLKKTTFLVFFTFLSTSLWAQTIIQGTVKDASTGKPVPDVNVYLSQTTYGAATNNRGTYKFTVHETGKFTLVFSFVGYKSKNFNIQLKPHGTKTVNVSLKKQKLSLKQTTVSGSNKAWEKHYRRFKKEFIGRTSYARKTSIKNPFVLNFREANHKLVARAREPLIIINKALGYKIRAELDKFEWSKSKRVTYQIQPQFKELEPNNEDQKKRWEHNREKTYEKSLQHFFRSLYQDKVAHNHFYIKDASFIALSKEETKFKLLGNPRATQDYANVLKAFKLQGKVRVFYSQTISFNDAVARATPKHMQSVLVPARSNHIIFVDNNGNLLDPLSLVIGGYWARIRFAHKLPLDYSPR